MTTTVELGALAHPLRGPQENEDDAARTGEAPADAHCPACKGTRLSPVLTVTARQAAQHFILRDEDPERNARLASNIQSLWGGENCRILSCESCGFGFSWPFVAGDFEFYNLAYRDAHYPHMKWEYRRTLEALRAKDTRNCAVLEIGAGVGFFLDLLTAEGIPTEAVTAIEYSDNARGALQKKGYASLAADIRSAAFDDRARSFDFIFIFQVVEHMDNLDAAFARLEYLLKPGGAIFVAVPNQFRTNYQEASGSMLDMPPNHIGRWTRKAFDAVAARAGLRVVAAEIEPFDPKSFMLEDMSFSHVQRAQDPNSLAGKIRSLPRGKFRWYAEAALAALWTPTRLPAWRRAFRDKENMGGALWVHLERAG
jgi:SAM-dependent methyltransferase